MRHLSHQRNYLRNEQLSSTSLIRMRQKSVVKCLSRRRGCLKEVLLLLKVKARKIFFNFNIFMSYFYAKYFFFIQFNQNKI